MIIFQLSYKTLKYEFESDCPELLLNLNKTNMLLPTINEQKKMFHIPEALDGRYEFEFLVFDPLSNNPDSQDWIN